MQQPHTGILVEEGRAAVHTPDVYHQLQACREECVYYTAEYRDEKECPIALHLAMPWWPVQAVAVTRFGPWWGPAGVPLR